jgi:hydrocephalus-inducing protein
VFYKVIVTVGEPDIAGNIELTSFVRESVSSIISIENPTDIEVTIASSEFVCDNEYIQITPASLKIPARSEKGFEIHYRPLIAKDSE